MKTFKPCLSSLAVVLVGTLVGCSATSTKTAAVSDSIRTALDQAGLKDVSVVQDREKGLVILSGHVAADGDKSQAESIARSIAGSQVVSNEIAVLPPGAEKAAKDTSSELDKGIEGNLDAALIQDRLQDNIVRCQESSRHTDRRCRLPIQARAGRNGRVFRSQRATGGERSADQGAKGQLVELTATLSQVNYMRETMTKSALNAFRRALEKKQAELVNGNRNRESLAIATSPEELDRIQYATEREIAIGNLERDYNVLRDVNAALHRIDTHTFGICLDCEEEISPKRLTAVPWTPCCIACQEAVDRSHKTTWSRIDTSLVRGGLKKFESVLLILWLLGFGFSVGGSLIHLLLVLALVVFVINLMSSRRVAA